MKKTCLQFKDILHLLEFVEYTKKHHCPVNIESRTIICEFSEADIELAIEGFSAAIVAN